MHCLSHAQSYTARLKAQENYIGCSIFFSEVVLEMGASRGSELHFQFSMSEETADEVTGIAKSTSIRDCSLQVPKYCLVRRGHHYS